MVGLRLPYNCLPVWAQNGVVSLFGLYWHWLRFGAGYRRFVQEYVAREGFTTDQWRNWQKHRLRGLLQAAAQVPYYRETWSESERVAAAAGILKDLPLLQRAAIQADPHTFLREDMQPRYTSIQHSSGTTGTPIATRWTVSEVRHSMALREARSARWAGVSFNMPRATLSGRMVEPNPQSKGPFYRYNIAERQVYLSAFHLGPHTAPLYVKALHKHHVRWMTGYAVAFHHLARFTLDQGLVVPSSLKAVITTSEKLSPEMRRVMEAAYGCRVYEEYSTAETALFASQCERGRLHVSPDAAVVEILRPDGSPCDPGEDGEVVATSFIHEYQPFIRFPLGDIASWDTDPCPCGRSMPVLREVAGRVEDVLTGPDGRRVSRLQAIFPGLRHVCEGQIVQESLHRIRVNVVVTNGFGAADVSQIIDRVQNRFGAVEVLVEPVAAIRRTKNGKFRAVVSLLHDGRNTEHETTGIAQ